MHPKELKVAIIKRLPFFNHLSAEICLICNWLSFLILTDFLFFSLSPVQLSEHVHVPLKGDMCLKQESSDRNSGECNACEIPIEVNEVTSDVFPGVKLLALHKLGAIVVRQIITDL